MTVERDFWTYATSQLEKIASFTPTTPEESTFAVERSVVDRCKEVIGLLCNDVSKCVFPHIAPDGENGVSATWQADKFSLAIIVHSDGEVYISTMTPKTPLRVSPLEEFNLSALPLLIRALSVHVEDVNPRWRDCLPD